MSKNPGYSLILSGTFMGINQKSEFSFCKMSLISENINVTLFTNIIIMHYIFIRALFPVLKALYNDTY